MLGSKDTPHSFQGQGGFFFFSFCYKRKEQPWCAQREVNSLSGDREHGIWSTRKDRKTDEEGKSTASTKSPKDVSRGVT